MAQPNLYYSESAGAFIMEFTTTGQLLGIKQDSDLFLVASLPVDAEIHMWGGDVTGAINNARLNGKSRFYIDATRLLEDYSDLRGLYFPE